MKILIVSQYFWPEDFRINDIAKALKEKGYEVEVLTGIPNYPKGEKLAGFSLLRRTHKNLDGIKVYRTPMFVRGKSGAFRLILNYMSYMVFGTVRAIPFLFKKYDRIFIFQISPITSCIPALFIAKVKNIKSLVYIQDLWPETFYSIVNIKNKKIKSIMKKLCNKTYDGFSTILIASQGYRDILVQEGIDNEKIKYFPQWAEDFYSINHKEIIRENKLFIITFAGNIGKAQSVETIIKAANHIKEIKKDLNIKWQIIGDGSEFENIKNLAKEYQLDESYVKFLGRKASNDMPKYFSESDALVVTLKNEEILKVTLPAKVQSYMAAEKPILCSVSGEGMEIIKEAKCGLVSEAEDYKELAKNVIKLSEMKKEERNILAKNGKIYFKKHFTRNKMLNQLEMLMS